MPTLHTSGNIKLSDLITFFGAGTKLSDFYRDGGIVLGQKTITSTVRNPYYGAWSNFVYQQGVTYYSSQFGYFWGQSPVSDAPPGTDGYQYRNDGAGAVSRRTVEYRDTATATITNINQSIPTSGDLKLSDFYGVEKP